ncbi:hypothetical protein PICSAR26_04154 [Mycobacterium avium subsp. paratuberculosis]|nr:hypothetical protein PICSAR26_04154 [Mycobacterium avium subsp. paratuberculosis]
MPSTSTAATSTGSVPGSGITASRLRSAPISAAASSPMSGWPTIAALPPAAVTAATMLNSSDRAPESTATDPRGTHTDSASHRGMASKDSAPSRSAGAAAPDAAPDILPDISAIRRRSDSSRSARVSSWRLEAKAAVMTSLLSPLVARRFRMHVRFTGE